MAADGVHCRNGPGRVLAAAFQCRRCHRLVACAGAPLKDGAGRSGALWPAMSRSWRLLSRCPQRHSPWGINSALWISTPSSHHRRAPLWSRWISSRRAWSPRAAWVVMGSGWSGVMPACCNQWRSRRIPSPSRWVRCGPEAARRNSTPPRWRQAAPAMIPPHRCAGCAGSGDQTAPAMFVDADASSPQGSKEPSSSVWMAIRARCSRSAGRCSTASPL